MTPTPRPLSELNTVNWKAYRHAYGRASDIPKLLRTIAEAAPEAAANALNQLENSIFHQGIAPADEVVLALLPFLLELVLHGPEQHRTGLLSLLHQILLSMKDFRAYAWDEGYFPPKWLELQQQLLELGPLLTPLLESPMFSLALTTNEYFNVVAHYHDNHAERLDEILSLPNEKMRVGLVAHLIGLLEDTELTTQPSKSLVSRHEAEQSFPTRWALALYLATTLKDTVPESVLGTLGKALGKTPQLDQYLGESWKGCSFLPTATALEAIGQRAAHFAPILAAQLPHQQYGGYWLQKAVLGLAFGTAKGLSAENMTSVQREVLELFNQYQEKNTVVRLLFLNDIAPEIMACLDSLRQDKETH